MPSASIKSRVEQILGPTTQVHAVAAVRLYVAESQSHWEWTRVAGAAALATTNEPGRYLYVVDLKNNSIPLTQEIYENFGYEAPREFFHSFEMDDCVAGLSFADTADAKAFYQAVTSKTSAPASRPQPPHPPASRPASHPPVQAPPPAAQPPQPAAQPPNVYSSTSSQSTANPPSPQLSTKSANNNATAAASGGSAGKKKAGGGIFSKLKSAFASSDVPEDFVVSDPRGFRHESHIGWDPEAGFEIRNIPPEWRKLFQAAGVRKNDLRDAETAKFVMNVIGETIMNTGMGGGEEPHHEAAAPAAPTPGGPAPPPPPPPPAHKTPGTPPPPPPGGKSASRPPPPARDARNDLMNSIKQGTELRKVDPNEPRPAGLPDINSMNPTDSKNLVDTLAAAMAARRNAIQAPAEDEEDEEEWSE